MSSYSNISTEFSLIVPEILVGIINTYHIGRKIGKGFYSSCYEVTSENNNKKYAAKIMSEKFMTESRSRKICLKNELKIHALMDHPNIVKLEEIIYDLDNIIIIMELGGKDLRKLVGKVSEEQIRGYLPQIVNALKHIHEHGIIHRDIKPANLLLSDQTIKLCDFGLAEFDEIGNKMIVGTPNYISPEAIRNSESFETDIWSLGVTIYTLIVGIAPFETESVKKTYYKIRMCDFTIPSTISSDLSDLISKMLIIDRKKRITLDEILTHPFLNGAKNLSGSLVSDGNLSENN